ncbi:MAG: L,D-transpeptidase [Prosthecobacter sp.]|nr:L,D-transpeptidase [Prosthecobacter sp.]
MRSLIRVLCLSLLVLSLAACGHRRVQEPELRVAELTPGSAAPQRLVIGVAHQKMVTFDWQKPRKMYPVSTSKFGLGDKPGSGWTPLGQLEVVKIVGEGLPTGSRLKARQPTGEIVPVDAPGRDPIVTRVLILKGREKGNAQTLQRLIYIHGTPAEGKLETPASWGCIRMASADIIELCRWIKPGARVDIVTGKVPAPNQLPQ